FVDESFAFYGKYLAGARENKPRWKRCAEATDRLLGDALGKKYVEKNFPPEAKARMEELVANLRLAMKQTIESLTWMTPPTRATPRENVQTLVVKIGYPEKGKDYSAAAIDRALYWESQVNARRWNVDGDRHLVGNKVDRTRWGMTPPTS